jgi:hypothetical protein
MKLSEEGFIEQNKRSDIQTWRFETIVFENNEAIIIEWTAQEKQCGSTKRRHRKTEKN